MHDGHRTMNTDNDCTATLLSDADVIAAMREIPGYLDISPADFREVFQEQTPARCTLDSIRPHLALTDTFPRPTEGGELDLTLGLADAIPFTATPAEDYSETSIAVTPAASARSIRPEQEAFMTALQDSGQQVLLWRPEHLFDGAIDRTLRAIAKK